MITRHILDLDLRGFPPTLSAVQDMANKLLAERGAGQVGEKWPRNFVKRTDSLTTRFNRPYDRQRALCEDPEAIQAWFELVARTKATYRISDEDTYNFDETGFIMGKILAQLVVTGLERRGRPKAVAIDQLKKGAEVIAHEATLMRDRIARLKKANKAATTRRKRKKRRIQQQGTLRKVVAEEIIA